MIVLVNPVRSFSWAEKLRLFGIVKLAFAPMASYTQVSWERMTNAVERVRQRLLRAVRALEQAHLPYAVAGGIAVAAWVSRLEEASVPHPTRA